MENEFNEELEHEKCCCEHCECEDNTEDNSSSEKEQKGKKEKKGKGKKEIEELKSKIEELEDKGLRDRAEIINFKRRHEEETSRMLKYSNEDLIKELLPVIDNFERAISMDDDNLEDEVSKFLEGFKMIYCNLTSILNSIEVKAIDGANKPFDPTYHQAVMTEKVEGKEPDMVIEVLQKGYVYKDRVIRPAMVKVSE